MSEWIYIFTYIAYLVVRYVQRAVLILCLMPDILTCCCKHLWSGAEFQVDSQWRVVPLQHHRPSELVQFHWTKTLLALVDLKKTNYKINSLNHAVERTFRAKQILYWVYTLFTGEYSTPIIIDQIKPQHFWYRVHHLMQFRFGSLQYRCNWMDSLNCTHVTSIFYIDHIISNEIPQFVFNNSVCMWLISYALSAVVYTGKM